MTCIHMHRQGADDTGKINSIIHLTSRRAATLFQLLFDRQVYEQPGSSCLSLILAATSPAGRAAHFGAAVAVDRLVDTESRGGNFSEQDWPTYL
jgi:hypothetical protein